MNDTARIDRAIRINLIAGGLMLALVAVLIALVAAGLVSFGPRVIVSLPAVAGRPVTVSAGVARFPADGTDAETLLEAAATALAQARADGRGQAVLNPG